MSTTNSIPVLAAQVYEHGCDASFQNGLKRYDARAAATKLILEIANQTDRLHAIERAATAFAQRPELAELNALRNALQP